jgi:hypothetical protein
MKRHKFVSGFLAKKDSEPDQLPEEIPQGHLFYQLIGRKVVPALDMQGPMLLEDAEGRVVERTAIGDAEISTVFLVINHGWGKKPVLFETMIFGGTRDMETYRCTTYAEAEAQHRMAVDLVRGDGRWDNQ